MLHILPFVFVIAVWHQSYFVCFPISWCRKHLLKSNIEPFLWFNLPSLAQLVGHCVETWWIWMKGQTKPRVYLSSYFVQKPASSAFVSHLQCPHRGQNKEPNSFCLSNFVFQHKSPSPGHSRWNPVKYRIFIYLRLTSSFLWSVSKVHGMHLHSFLTWFKYFWVWHSSLLWTMHFFWWSGSFSKFVVPVILFRALIP